MLSKANILKLLFSLLPRSPTMSASAPNGASPFYPSSRSGQCCRRPPSLCLSPTPKLPNTIALLCPIVSSVWRSYRLGACRGRSHRHELGVGQAVDACECSAMPPTHLVCLPRPHKEMSCPRERKCPTTPSLGDDPLRSFSGDRDNPNLGGIH